VTNPMRWTQCCVAAKPLTAKSAAIIFSAKSEGDRR
jgi:hypothetical protein